MYRLVAADSRKARDGRFLEILGFFDPLNDAGVQQVKQERVLTWLRQGAQPSVTVRTLLRRAGLWKQFETEKAVRTKKPGRIHGGSAR
jgi:small subunit ribosomal protein S16